MARERNTADITANGGGESSATGNTLIYDMPSNPSKSTLYGKVVKLWISNLSGANGDVILGDDDTVGNTMPAVAPFRVNASANETIFLDEDDIGDFWIVTGLIAQASNGATSSGYKVTAEIELI